jgi:hypothetical protein
VPARARSRSTAYASTRDGAAIRDVATITVKALSDAEVVLVDSR